MDYLGRISNVEDDTGTKNTTANDHRLNQKFDVYITRDFFWTPVFSEYYSDEFQNIASQVTVGVGLGYMFIDTSKTEWSISTGPAIVHTRYHEVPAGDKQEVTSPAMEFSTKLEYEISSMTDFKFDYKFTVTDKNSGSFKHHMVATIENELTSWMDLDVSFIWDRLKDPEPEATGTIPESDDYQLLIGFGIDF